MKKTGILTFHWAANYGAVLQACALQTYLSRAGHDAEIIDYRPGRVLLIQTTRDVPEESLMIRDDNRLVDKDVPDNAVVAGSPMHIVSR